MFADFDICVHSKELAVLEFASDGTNVIKIYDPERKKQTSIVDSSFISLSPRLSSRGNQLAFCSNDGRMYVKNLSNETITPLYDRNGFEAGFCEWSRDGKKICFSSHSVNPPNIYYLDLENQNVIQ